MLSVSLILLSASACLAQVSFPGSCPNLPTKENFDVTRYVGKWYEAAKYFAKFQENGKCVTATYTPNQDGSVRVDNALISTITDKLVTINGTATFAGNANEAKLLVTFSTDPAARKAPYWVIDTDYENWAVVHSCENSNDSSIRFSWILTRAQNPSSVILNQAYDVVDRNNISREHYIVTDQTHCSASE